MHKDYLVQKDHRQIIHFHKVGNSYGNISARLCAQDLQFNINEFAKFDAAETLPGGEGSKNYWKKLLGNCDVKSISIPWWF